MCKDTVFLSKIMLLNGIFIHCHILFKTGQYVREHDVRLPCTLLCNDSWQPHRQTVRMRGMDFSMPHTCLNESGAMHGRCRCTAPAVVPQRWKSFSIAEAQQHARTSHNTIAVILLHAKACPAASMTPSAVAGAMCLHRRLAPQQMHRGMMHEVKNGLFSCAHGLLPLLHRLLPV